MKRSKGKYHEKYNSFYNSPACEQLNRKCYMMELDPKYVDVIIARWENLTGQKAEKIN